MESYWRQGVGALSLNERCKRAQLSKPALYREFGGEDGLMEAALVAYRETVLAPLFEALLTDAPFDPWIDALLTELTAERPGPAGCLFTEMRTQRAQLGPATEARLSQLERERRQALEAWYRRRLERGEVSDTVSPELAARYIDAQLSLLLLQMGAGEEPDLVRAQAQLALSALSAPD